MRLRRVSEICSRKNRPDHAVGHLHLMKVGELTQRNIEQFPGIEEGRRASGPAGWVPTASGFHPGGRRFVRRSLTAAASKNGGGALSLLNRVIPDPVAFPLIIQGVGAGHAAVVFFIPADGVEDELAVAGAAVFVGLAGNDVVGQAGDILRR